MINFRKSLNIKRYYRSSILIQASIYLQASVSQFSSHIHSGNIYLYSNSYLVSDINSYETTVFGGCKTDVELLEYRLCDIHFIFGIAQIHPGRRKVYTMSG